MPAKRNKAGQFVKGVSGNPSGRKKIPEEVKKMLKESTTEAARLLIDTVNNENASLSYRLDAAKEILNRVYGKSIQPIDGDMDTTVQITLSEGIQKYAK